jgi:PKD repeat protein
VSHVYASAGSYNVTLVVEDDSGSVATAQTTAVISEPGSQPLTWSNSFSSIGTDNKVTLTLIVDLTEDLTETSGPEALYRWEIQELSWDPTVLQFESFAFAPGVGGTRNLSQVSSGRILAARGFQPTGSQTGILTLATIRFAVTGASGSSTMTQTALAALVSTAALGSFNYLPFTKVVEASLTVP